MQKKQCASCGRHLGLYGRCVCRPAIASYDLSGRSPMGRWWVHGPDGSTPYPSLRGLVKANDMVVLDASAEAALLLGRV